MVTRRSRRVAEPPDGFRYLAEFLGADEERGLVRLVEGLPFEPFVFRGVEARRRVVHLGHRYDFEARGLEPGLPIPPLLLDLRERIAPIAERPAERFEEVLATEYRPGATIGWHRDAPLFGPKVVGVSLAAACRMRFQRGKGDARQVAEVTLEPRSAYVLSGAARWSWQHSIPATKALRWSVTFRTLKEPGGR